MILDTNALSAFVNGDVGVGELMRQQPRAAIPVIVLGEFRYGIAESRHRRTYEAWLESELPHFDVLAVTDETAVTCERSHAFPDADHDRSGPAAHPSERLCAARDPA